MTFEIDSEQFLAELLDEPVRNTQPRPTEPLNQENISQLPSPASEFEDSTSNFQTITEYSYLIVKLDTWSSLTTRKITPPSTHPKAPTHTLKVFSSCRTAKFGIVKSSNSKNIDFDMFDAKLHVLIKASDISKALHIHNPHQHPPGSQSKVSIDDLFSGKRIPTQTEISITLNLVSPDKKFLKILTSGFNNALPDHLMVQMEGQVNNLNFRNLDNSLEVTNFNECMSSSSYHQLEVIATGKLYRVKRYNSRPTTAGI